MRSLMRSAPTSNPQLFMFKLFDVRISRSDWSSVFRACPERRRLLRIWALEYADQWRAIFLSDSKLNATESPKLFATEKKSRGKPRQTNVDERFAWNTCIIRNAANPIDSPELGVIRKGVDCVNSFSHWPIITDSRHYPNWPFQDPRLVVANNVERSVASNLAKITASRI